MSESIPTCPYCGSKMKDYHPVTGGNEVEGPYLSRYTFTCEKGHDWDESDSGVMRIRDLEAEVERLRGDVRLWKVNAEIHQDHRAAAESEVKRLKVFEEFFGDTEDYECLDTCDSFAHDPLCPRTEPMAAYVKLREQLAALRERVEGLGAVKSELITLAADILTRAEGPSWIAEDHKQKSYSARRVAAFAAGMKEQRRKWAISIRDCADRLATPPEATP